MTNIFRPVFEPLDGQVPYAALGRLAGARTLDLRLYRLEPGDTIEIGDCTEQLMVVERGSPTVDAEAGPRHLAQGDVWVCPEARAGRVSNLTREPAEVLVVVAAASAARERARRRRGDGHRA